MERALQVTDALLDIIRVEPHHRNVNRKQVNMFFQKINTICNKIPESLEAVDCYEEKPVIVFVFSLYVKLLLLLPSELEINIEMYIKVIQVFDDFFENAMNLLLEESLFETELQTVRAMKFFISVIKPGRCTQENLWKFMDHLCCFGDYEYQLLILKFILLQCPALKEANTSKNFFPGNQIIQNALRNVSKEHFEKSARIFLNQVNNIKNEYNYKYVLSIVADCINVDDITVMWPNSSETNDIIWVDFNTESKSISIQCPNDDQPQGKEIIKIYIDMIHSIEMKGCPIRKDNNTDASILRINLNTPLQTNSQCSNKLFKTANTIKFLLRASKEDKILIRNFLEEKFPDMPSSLSILDRLQQICGTEEMCARSKSLRDFSEVSLEKLLGAKSSIAQRFNLHSITSSDLKQSRLMQTKSVTDAGSFDEGKGSTHNSTTKHTDIPEDAQALSIFKHPINTLSNSQKENRSKPHHIPNDNTGSDSEKRENVNLTNSSMTVLIETEDIDSLCVASKKRKVQILSDILIIPKKNAELESGVYQLSPEFQKSKKTYLLASQSQELFSLQSIDAVEKLRSLEDSGSMIQCGQRVLQPDVLKERPELNDDKIVDDKKDLGALDDFESGIHFSQTVRQTDNLEQQSELSDDKIVDAVKELRTIEDSGSVIEVSQKVLQPNKLKEQPELNDANIVETVQKLRRVEDSESVIHFGETILQPDNFQEQLELKDDEIVDDNIFTVITQPIQQKPVIHQPEEVGTKTSCEGNRKKTLGPTEKVLTEEIAQKSKLEITTESKVVRSVKDANEAIEDFKSHFSSELNKTSNSSKSVAASILKGMQRIIFGQKKQPEKTIIKKVRTYKPLPPKQMPKVKRRRILFDPNNLEYMNEICFEKENNSSAEKVVEEDEAAERINKIEDVDLLKMESVVLVESKEQISSADKETITIRRTHQGAAANNAMKTAIKIKKRKFEEKAINEQIMDVTTCASQSEKFVAKLFNDMGVQRPSRKRSVGTGRHPKKSLRHMMKKILWRVLDIEEKLKKIEEYHKHTPPNEISTFDKLKNTQERTYKVSSASRSKEFFAKLFIDMGLQRPSRKRSVGTRRHQKKSFRHIMKKMIWRVSDIEEKLKKIEEYHMQIQINI